VVGVTTYCTYPPEARRRSIVGGTTTQTINLETILRLEPDLVLAGGFGQEDVVAALRREGVFVHRNHPGTISDTLATILSVGEVVGKRTEAAELVSRLSGSIERFGVKAAGLAAGARPRVFLLVWDDPLLTAGSQTFVGEILELAGGDNVFADLAEDFPRIGVETLVRRRPEVVVIPSHHGAEGGDPQVRLARSGFANLLENTRYVTVDGDLVSRPGPRIADAVAAVATAIHGAAWVAENPSR
jgi:iron complex transport system substrate-binding protein